MNQNSSSWAHFEKIICECNSLLCLLLPFFFCPLFLFGGLTIWIGNSPEKKKNIFFLNSFFQFQVRKTHLTLFENGRAVLTWCLSMELENTLEWFEVILIDIRAMRPTAVKISNISEQSDYLKTYTIWNHEIYWDVTTQREWTMREIRSLQCVPVKNKLKKKSALQVSSRGQYYWS